ncbi:hypothetical protein COT44_01095 [Candidatus Shapirobacteria bacterium CG08_land_8_20_14_0_20_39_18]|uniref:Glycosyltransferase 2-like domain-containing protein n=1 Tax=Candidatus Shapirobacteria bacterium CG08_land_8_20_14_0_20_39_18 TaxID=1974883 RepID=A0A2M6XDX8_9BACT|nr:MAG: hypothetical protein COT44_01095 [Candidatus Shapirobacteria bacterium CG08_land_8_20_14_0_20_39_18]PJE68030.1 MAG: hypothetical protein COU94_03955 [Candidatus Shapirobacteria bacterium CG10_big_fil_rev_8_21_14_0_10_38_8]
MKNQTYLSVIIPCYNESENIQRGVLDEVETYLQKQKFSWEVIISDDGSTDGSWDLVEKFIDKNSKFIHLNNKHGGKPSAVRSGIEKAKGEWVLFTDMDQATPINQLDKLLPYFGKDDIVIGSRGMTRKNFPIYRKLASFVFLNFRRLLLLSNIKDTQCGFKAFKREIALKLFPKLEFFRKQNQISGWKVSAYDVELLFLAEKNGYIIAEVPVVWEDTDISKGKQRSFIKESKEMLFEIIRVRLNDLKGKYD